MALHLSQQQFTYLCKRYANREFGYVYFDSIRELLSFVLKKL